MYSHSYYKEKDRTFLLEFMRENSFAMLIGSSNDIPAATQIPLLIEERGEKIFLKGHFMRNTDHHRAFEQNPNALCIFTGAHAYVSASLYTDPQTASTWNYISVHARGQMKFIDNEDLFQMLKELTDHYEGHESISSFTQLSKDYVEKLSKAIIGFEIEVNEMDNIFKLSQNRDESSYERIIHHLGNGDESSRQIATEMEKRKAHLFTEKRIVRE